MVLLTDKGISGIYFSSLTLLAFCPPVNLHVKQADDVVEGVTASPSLLLLSSLLLWQSRLPTDR